MGRRIRYFEPDSVVEVSFRVMQGRFLLRPSARLNELVVGILGRGLERYPVKLLHISVMSNHVHLILWIPDSGTLSGFMCFLKTNIAKKVGRLHEWDERFWGRRFHAAPILDDEAMVEQIEYVLSKGRKEGLVNRPDQWPGVNGVNALLKGEPLLGTWFDWTREDMARRRGDRFDPYDFATRYEVLLTPVPFMARWSEEEQTRWYRKLIRKIVRRTRRMHRKNGTKAAGVARVRERDPHHRPDRPDRKPAPLCHAADTSTWQAFVDRFREIRQAYRAASRRWRNGDQTARFPGGCFAPPALRACGGASRAPP